MLIPTVLMYLTTAPWWCSSRQSSVCTFHEDAELGGLYADCSNKGLSRIPGDFPTNTTSIDLNDNRIIHIQNNSFKYLDTLQSLTMRGNMIATLEIEAFTGCDKLKHLDLSSNQLVFNDACIPRGVFSPLGNLNWLSILGNTLGDNGSYPEDLFSNMTQLQTLKLDAIGEPHFGEGFKSLRHLKNFILGEDYCKITTLRNETFLSFVNISVDVLNLTFCPIVILESGTFAPLRELQELLMAMCYPVGLHTALRSLSSFIGRTMRVLDLRKVHLRHQTSAFDQVMGGVISDVNLQYISKICLKKVMLSNNMILYINITSLLSTKISSCIEHLDTSVNRFHGDFFRFYAAIHTFPQLSYLDISKQEMALNSPFIPQIHYDEVLHYNFTRPMGRIVSSMQSPSRFTVTISFPPRLRSFYASAISGNIGSIRNNVKILNGEFMTLLNFSFDGLAELTTIQGLFNLEVFDLSGNENLMLVDTFFDAFPALEHLYLNYFSLQQTPLLQQGRRLLGSLPHLKSLHLRFNHLTHLPSNLFTANPLLEHIDLSNNMLKTIPFDPKLTPINLHVLDIASNSLGHLDIVDLDRIDSLVAAVDGHFRILLDGNHFSCGCHGIVFLFWLKETKTHMDNDKNFTCFTDNGDSYNTARAVAGLDGIWRQCSGMETFFVSFSIFVLLLATLLSSLLVKTNHTVLVHVFMNVLRRQIPRPQRTDYTYDVYLAYADAQDYQWICHHLRQGLEDQGLRLFLWDRDSVPGDSIPDQIAENIANSWKIVMYYTINYERDPYSYFSMMAAIRCVDNISPERIVLLLPETEHPRIPTCLLEVVPENCILTVSDTEEICSSLVNLVCKT